MLFRQRSCCANRRASRLFVALAANAIDHGRMADVEAEDERTVPYPQFSTSVRKHEVSAGFSRSNEYHIGDPGGPSAAGIAGGGTSDPVSGLPHLFSSLSAPLVTACPADCTSWPAPATVWQPTRTGAASMTTNER